VADGDVVIEFCGRTFDLPGLLVAKVKRELDGSPELARSLRDGLAGRVPVVVLQSEECAAFYTAARSAFTDLEIPNEMWTDLMGELRAKCEG
jgi:hypothetical protein